MGLLGNGIPVWLAVWDFFLASPGGCVCSSCFGGLHGAGKEVEKRDEKIKVPCLSLLSSWYSMAWEGVYVISLLELKKLRLESDNFLKCYKGFLNPWPCLSPLRRPDSLACFLGLDLLLGGGVLWPSIPRWVLRGCWPLALPPWCLWKKSCPCVKGQPGLAVGSTSSLCPWAQMRCCAVGNAIWLLQQQIRPGNTTQVCARSQCRRR